MALGFFDVDRLGGNFASWFVVFVAGFAVTVASIEVSKRFFRNLSDSLKRSTYLIVALLLSGILRGLVVYEVGFLLTLIPEDELIYRLTSAPLFVLSSYFFSNALVTSFQNFREQARTLSSELDRLKRSRTTYTSDLQLVNQQQRNRVQELLSAPMWELQKKLETATNPAGVRDALLTMQSINNEVVRPLSHELSESVGEPSSPDLITPKVRGWLPALPKKVNLSETQPGWLLFGVLLVLGLNTQIALTSIAQGIQIVAVAVAPPAILFYLEKRMFRRVSLSVPAATTISVLFGAFSAALGGLLVESLGLEVSESFLWQSVFLMVILKTSNLIYGIFLAGWQQTLAQLIEVNAEQRLVNSRLRQQLWLGQKALAMELHGSVQATLQALAFRLSRMQEINLQEIQQILASVRQALNRIENQEYLAGQPFEVLLEELRELWEGTAEITWAISSNAQSELDSDLGLARCCFEVIRESVTNAVKHGSANDIAISIDRTHNLLLLQIVNNGSVTNIQQGSLGSELMDQLCLARTLVEIEGRVSLNAELALNPEVALQSLAS